MGTRSAKRDPISKGRPARSPNADELSDELRSLLDHVGRILAEEYAALVDPANDATVNNTHNDQEKPE